MSTTTPPHNAALADVDAHPRRGVLVQAVAVLATATPVLAVAAWAMTTVF